MIKDKDNFSKVENVAEKFDLDFARKLMLNVERFGSLKQIQVSKPFGEFGTYTLEEWTRWYRNHVEFIGMGSLEESILGIFNSIDRALQDRSQKELSALLRLFALIEKKNQVIKSLMETTDKLSDQIDNMKSMPENASNPPISNNKQPINKETQDACKVEDVETEESDDESDAEEKEACKVEDVEEIDHDNLFVPKRYNNNKGAKTKK